MAPRDEGPEHEAHITHEIDAARETAAEVLSRLQALRDAREEAHRIVGLAYDEMADLNTIFLKLDVPEVQSKPDEDGYVQTFHPGDPGKASSVGAGRYDKNLAVHDAFGEQLLAAHKVWRDKAIAYGGAAKAYAEALRVELGEVPTVTYEGERP